MTRFDRPVESVRGVVLAGGASTRFGAGDKALASVGSQPVLRRIVDVLERSTDREPVIAVRTPDQQSRYATVVPTNAQFVFDAPDHDGPLAGLVGSATALDSRWLFCCGCDMPLLAPLAVRWLLDQLCHEQPVDAVAVEDPTGGLEPLHSVYRRESVLDCHLRLPRTAGPRMLLSELDTVVTISTADAPPHVPLEASSTNVNTREELDAIRNADP